MAETTRKKMANRVASKWASRRIIIGISERHKSRLQKISDRKNDGVEAKDKLKKRKTTKKLLTPRYDLESGR